MGTDDSERRREDRNRRRREATAKRRPKPKAGRTGPKVTPTAPPSEAVGGASDSSSSAFDDEDAAGMTPPQSTDTNTAAAPDDDDDGWRTPAARPDSAGEVTVLIANDGKIYTKKYRRSGGKVVKIAASKPPFFHDYRIKDFSTPRVGCELLRKLCGDPHAIIVRGQPIAASGGSRKGVLGVRQSKGDTATVQDVPRRWVCFDLDTIPVGTLDPMGEPSKTIRTVIDWAIPEATDVTLVCQWSASMAVGSPEGLKKITHVKAHVWVWLDEPHSSAEIKRWAEALNKTAPAPCGEPGKKPRLVDPALFQPVQPHYVAAPILEDLEDPFGDGRVFLLEGARDVAHLDIPHAPAQKDSHAKRPKHEHRALAVPPSDATTALASLLAGKVRDLGLETAGPDDDSDVWPTAGEGVHEHTRALAGFVLRRWARDDDNERLLRAVVPPREETRSDDEIGDLVRSTRLALGADEPATGREGLKKLFAPRIGDEAASAVVGRVEDLLAVLRMAWAFDGVDLVLPAGYSIDPQGRIVSGPKSEVLSMRPIWIADRFVTEEGGVELRLRCGWRGARDALDVALPRDAFVNGQKMLKTLAPLAVPITDSNKRAFVNYFAAFEEVNRERFAEVRLVHRLGWHGDRFVLDEAPDLRIVPNADGEREILKAIGVAGGEEQSLRAIDLIRDCPTAIMAILASLAAPWLRHVDVGSFGVHLFGDTTGGKTTALELAASMWGNPHPEGNGLIGTFNTTVVGLEQRAAFLCDMPTLIDEVKQAAGNEALMKIVYELCGGIGRSRGAKEGGSRRTPTWRTIMLSTGEAALTSSTSYGGPGARVIELYGQPLSSGQLAITLEKIIRTNYGHLGRAMVDVACYPDAITLFKATYKREQERLAQELPGALASRMAKLGAVLIATGEVFQQELIPRHSALGQAPVNVRRIVTEAMAASLADILPYAEMALDKLRSWVAANRIAFTEKSRTRAGAFFPQGVFFFPTELERICLRDLGLDYDRVLKDFSARGWFKRNEKGKRQCRRRVEGKLEHGYLINALESPSSPDELRTRRVLNGN
ncbi:MAG: DUF927 domain-containing protein [Acidobacteriota bacterium]